MPDLSRVPREVIWLLVFEAGDDVVKSLWAMGVVASRRPVFSRFNAEIGRRRVSRIPPVAPGGRFHHAFAPF
jgi:hypothetical protein